MSLINELKEKSTKAEVTKNEVIAEIKSEFDKYLNSDRLENHLKQRIGNTEIKERKVFMKVEFWEYHSGCSTTHFHCGGCEWYNPEYKDGWNSHTYNGIELKDISNEICEYLSSRLINRMNELGFYTISKEKQNGRLGYYNTHFYFGW
jgi:hypothetical protein